ncbi:MAG: methyltransferase [Microgenomates group bacterium Gr01-1014_16]|nr:MAG: methyltransferase [Microgenomates group bacterium Gr01-1014_16]
MRQIKPSRNYWLAHRSVRPLSSKFGFDRGTPIDRYWIESFLSKHHQDIQGRCLEVTDSKYTTQFGQHIIKSDILDINPKNKLATIHGDLRHLPKVKSNTYDCIILTQVLGLIDDYESAIGECRRILKPEGILLVTMASLCPTFYEEGSFWRLTTASAKFVFKKYFKPQNLLIQGYGNILTGQCFWVGMCQEELTKKELEYYDPSYTCLVSIRAVKD